MLLCAVRAMLVVLAGRLATCFSRLGGWLLLWLKGLTSFACFAFAGCSRSSRRVPCADCLLTLAHCYSSDLPSCFGHRVSGGVCQVGPYQICAGPSPRHFYTMTWWQSQYPFGSRPGSVPRPNSQNLKSVWRTGQP